MTETNQRPRGRKRKAARRVLLFINLGFIFLLLLSYLAAYINPNYIWWMELFALAYGILTGINLVFIVLWIVLGKRYFIYSLIAVLLGISRLLGILQFHPCGDDATPVGDVSKHPQLKVMSYNVHLFDLYDWFNNFKVRENMFRFFSEESPDVVCFQEFYSSERKDFRFENADTLKRILAAPYNHIEYTLTLRGTDHWGIATYSKYPIINRQAAHFEGTHGNIFIYTDIVAGTDTFRVFNVHFESDRFQPADYRFVKDFDIGKNEESQVTGYWKRILSIIKRLKDSAIKRGQQAQMMEQYISQSPYPVIVCGDFNDVPASYTYRQVSANLKDAFRESGNGFGKTYAGAFPSFRIDYILHDKKLNACAFKTGSVKYSDHYPVSCILQMKD